MDLDTGEELSECPSPAEVLCRLRKQRPGKGKAKNLCHLWLLLTCLKQPLGCLQPMQKLLHELLVQLCTTAPKQQAAVQAPAVQLPAVQASGAATSAASARSAGSRGAGACGCKRGTWSSPGRAPVRDELFGRGMNPGTRTPDPLVRTSRQRGQDDEFSNSASAPPLVIRKAKGPPGAPQHAPVVCNFTQPQFQDLAAAYGQKRGERLAHWLLQVWDFGGDSTHLNPKQLEHVSAISQL